MFKVGWVHSTLSYLYLEGGDSGGDDENDDDDMHSRSITFIIFFYL